MRLFGTRYVKDTNISEPDLPIFGVIAGVNPTEVQWKGLALGDWPC